MPLAMRLFAVSISAIRRSPVSRRRAGKAGEFLALGFDPEPVEGWQICQAPPSAPPSAASASCASASIPKVTRALSSASSFGATRSTSAVGRGSVHTRVTSPAAVLGGVPTRRRVAADRPFADVAVMQIGDAQVPVLSAIAGEIVTRTEAGLAD